MDSALDVIGIILLSIFIFVFIKCILTLRELHTTLSEMVKTKAECIKISKSSTRVTGKRKTNRKDRRTYDSYVVTWDLRSEDRPGVVNNEEFSYKPDIRIGEKKKVFITTTGKLKVIASGKANLIILKSLIGIIMSVYILLYLGNYFVNKLI